MTLRQVARAPRGPYPPTTPRVPLAFAIELRTHGRFTIALVRCPWCGDIERVPEPYNGAARPCLDGAVSGAYFVGIPAGTPMMAPADDEAVRA